MKLLITLALISASAIAAAQDRPFYIGAHVGQSNADSFCDGLSGAGVSCNDRSDAGKAFAGYRIHRYVATELTYVNLGEAKATGPSGSITARSTAFDLSVLGLLPIGERVTLHARLGGYRADTKVRVRTTTLNQDDSETNTGLVYGFGGSYDITKRLTARAEWQKYNEVGGPSTGETDISFLSVGALFKF